jgi:hypothetical protein
MFQSAAKVDFNFISYFVTAFVSRHDRVLKLHISGIILAITPKSSWKAAAYRKNIIVRAYSASGEPPHGSTEEIRGSTPPALNALTGMRRILQWNSNYASQKDSS